MRDVDVAGGHLVQHRREEEEVVTADERDLHAGTSAELPFQFQGGVQAAEAAAKNDDVPGLHGGFDAARVGGGYR